MRGQSEQERIQKSRVIQTRLFAVPEFQRARKVLFYASFDGEVETMAMLRQAQDVGKMIALPQIIENPKSIVPAWVSDVSMLTPGPYGIMQPDGNSSRVENLSDLDLVVVPGVAFDIKGNRLGRGAGYYDRFLGEMPRPIPTVGLAFDFQMVDHLPDVFPHDIPVSRVITNN